MLLSQEQAPPFRLQHDFSMLLGQPVVFMARMGGGRNSRVYRLATAEGKIFAGKEYFSHPSDKRDRLRTEFYGLRFLWARGIRNVPQPVAANEEKQVAIYEFIPGQEIPSKEVGEADIDHAVDFLARLWRAGREAAGEVLLGAASAACFSVNDVHAIIAARLKRLTALQERSEAYEQLRGFIAGSFLPAYDRIGAWSDGFLRKNKIDKHAPLAQEARTLSPSDFGFHNAMRRKDGGVIFLDFEYFGWDDPAKMIADFLLHPAMRLSFSLRRRFAERVFDVFPGWDRLRKRVQAVYPLLGLVWCLILLNEFVPEATLRREFAGAAGELEAQRQAQLEQARNMLRKIDEEYEEFPFG